MSAGNQDVIGVLGGLGPLASSQFLRTLYQSYAPGVPEQRMARVLMLSDPSIADRSDALLRGDDLELLSILTQSLTTLRGLGASRLVICCFTMHHLLPRLPAPLREAIASLPKIALDETIRRRHPALLLCSRGTRALRVFPSQTRWPEARTYVRFPSDVDQERVHALIHALKANGCVAAAHDALTDLARTYAVDHVIAACTELHLVARHAAEQPPSANSLCYIDAPSLLAARIARATPGESHRTDSPPGRSLV